jgi:hypothetical protein
MQNKDNENNKWQSEKKTEKPSSTTDQSNRELRSVTRII